MLPISQGMIQGFPFLRTSVELNASFSQSVLAYGTGELGVQHIIVMGHYGCGGVEAAILAKPASQDAGSGAVQQWIQSIREILSSSSRAELVELRSRISAKPIEEIEIQDRASMPPAVIPFADILLL